MPTYTVEGLVLRTKNLGDADKILTLLTPQKGKIRGVARGARRPKNRLVAVSQPFVRGEFILYSGRGLDSIQQAEYQEGFKGLSEDLVEMAAATYLAELIDQFMEEGEPVEGLYPLLLKGLRRLSGGGDPLTLVRLMEVQSLALLGYEPALDGCGACGAQLVPPLRFSPEGGLICSDCQEGQVLPLSPGGREYLRQLLHWDLDRASVLRISPGMDREVAGVLRAFIDFRLERPLKSLEFFQSLVTP